MIEKVNPQHPDKIADRIAGALVDYTYTQSDMPKIAVEVLIGHGKVTIIAETSVIIPQETVEAIVQRISGVKNVEYIEVPQDPHLAGNQSEKPRTGDNGIFKGVPTDEEVKELSEISKTIYGVFPTDGKYILDIAKNRLIICQSQATDQQIQELLGEKYELTINPLGYWTGGTDVDT